MHRPTLRQPSERLLGRVLAAQAEAVPGEPFLRSGDRCLTYAEAYERVRAQARGLARLGVAPGETVALLMDASPECVLTALAVNEIRAIWVPTNTDYKGRWLRECFQDGRARVLVADAAHLGRVRELGGELPFEVLLVNGAAEARDLAPRVEALEALESLGQAPSGAPPAAAAGAHPGDTAAVIWTSGTTGRAKGVMESHEALLLAAENGAETVGVRDGDVIYSCLPMYHTAAWVANVLRAMVCGVSCAIDAHFSASAFWDRCRHYGATHTFTLGAMHMFLWQAPPRPDDASNPVRVASAIPLPAELEKPFKQRFGIETLFQGYGQSEALTVLARTPGRRWKPNALGEPQAGMEIALLDEDDLPVSEGQPGELCVRPSRPFSLFNGYFGDPEATVRAFRNLWYHTGDLMRQDEDGDLFFVDRKADFIRYKGRNLSSFAVEAAVAAHPEVEAVAAHGVVSAELDAEAELKVVVVRRAGSRLGAEKLARFVNETAPYFFVPRYVEFVGALPRTPTGRVQKYKLRERGVTPETWDARAAGFEVRR